MRNVLGLFLMMILSLSLVAQGQEKENTVIQSSVVRLFEGMSAIDADLIKAELTDDFILLEDGKIWNTDSLLNAVLKYKVLDIQRLNKLEFVSTQQKGNTAWVSYFNRADLSYKGKQMAVRWLESAVLVNEDRRWRIKMLHSTVLKPVATGQK